jgi:hypothetical protein
MDGEDCDTEKITKSLQKNLDEVWMYDTQGEMEKAMEVMRSGPPGA